MRVTPELAARLEHCMGEAVESLMNRSLTVAGKPEGYALLREGTVLATLSTNPRAGWATQTYGLTGRSAETVERVVEFYESHRVPACIRIQLAACDVPAAAIERLRPVRRAWLGTPGRRFYLAYVDGRPAAQAILYCNGDIGYLESAGTLPAFRRRGLQMALVRRRLADATALGCRLIFGGADFASQSMANQMACGLSRAYLAARWTQRAA